MKTSVTNVAYMSFMFLFQSLHLKNRALGSFTCIGSRSYRAGDLRIYAGKLNHTMHRDVLFELGQSMLENIDVKARLFLPSSVNRDNKGTVVHSINK